MNEENGKHEFNFFLDKQLQQKLLEANEELLEKEFASSLVQNNGLQSSNSNKNNNVNTGAQQNHKLPKYQDCVHVCGWCPNPNTVYRKSESDAPPRSRGHLAITRDSLYSRDSKSRPQNVDNFVFRHYSDPRRYIEQYRKEHACYDSTNSSATKNEFLETRRFYAYNQYSPLAVSSNANNTLHQSNSYVPQPQLEPPAQSSETITKSHHPQTPSLQYTNRREQKRNTISASLNAKNQHQYKLTKTPPNANKQDRVSDYTEEYIESLEIIKKQRHTGSAKERSSAAVNGTGVQKSAATKINVPSANFGGKTLRTANTGSSSENSLPSHFPVHKTGHNTTGRMLDSLACVAGNGAGADKQDSGITAPIDRPSKEELLESLRNVNQRPSKPSPRPLHLTYYTGDTTTPTTSDSNSTVNDRRSSGDGGVCAGCLDYNQHQNHHLQKRQRPPPQHQHQNQDDKSNFSPSQLTEDNNTNTFISSDITREFRKDENSHASRGYDNAVNDRRICTCDGSDASASESKTYDSNGIESGECVDNVTVSNTSMSKRPHKSDHHDVRKEIIFMPEKEGTQILSSARDVNVDDDSDFLSTASDWKQICAEYKSNDSAFLIREAKNEEYKNLIAERFDHKSSLSHQRRIKHLIEQSRLKSHLGNASRIHLTSGIGDEPVRRFIDIKNGINTSTSGDFRSRYRNRYVTRDSNIVREDVGSGVKEVKKKKCKLKFTIISPLARELSSFDNVCENKNDNNNSLPHKPDAGDIDTSPNNEDGLNGHLVDHCHKKTDMNETLKTDDVNFPNSTKTVDSSQKIHVVPFGDTDADCTTGDHCDNHENKGTLSYSNSNVNKSSYSTVAFRSLYKHTGSKSSNLKIHNRDINTTTTTSNFENHSDKAIYQRIPSDTTSRYQDSTGEDNLKNSAKEGDADKNCLKCVVKEHTIIIDKVHGGSFNVNHRKGDNHFKNKNENDFSGFFDICNQNKGNIHVNTKNQKSDIPVICGTAIRENNVLKGGNLKSRSYGHNASTTSSKPKRLSPLSESNIEVLAAKMAVKINMTRLQKYTKPGVVRRSQSMDL